MCYVYFLKESFAFHQPCSCDSVEATEHDILSLVNLLIKPQQEMFFNEPQQVTETSKVTLEWIRQCADNTKISSFCKNEVNL